MARRLLACPNCSAVWGFDEIEDQECGACGYPNNDDNDDECDPDYVGPDPEDSEPDLMGKDWREEAERMAWIQRNLK